MDQMPSFEQVKKAMTASGFVVLETQDYFIKPDLKDQFLYSGKQNPALYLNPEIRKGISSFSSLSNQMEVENGLIQLKNDMNSGKIEEIMNSYENDLGDYIFIIGLKQKK